jgi:hypothetical protein
MAEVVLASFEVLAWHLPDDTAETTKDLPLRMSGLQDMI